MTPERARALAPARHSTQSCMQGRDAGELPLYMSTVQRHTRLVSYLSSHSTPFVTLPAFCSICRCRCRVAPTAALQKECRAYPWRAAPRHAWHARVFKQRVELLRLSVLTGEEGAGPQFAYTPRYAKPEGRPRRTPQTARPANGVPPSRVLYERPSAPYAMEWEDSCDENDQVWECLQF